MKTSFYIFLTALLVAVSGVAQKAASASRGSAPFDFRKKAESKEGTRWTLKEWLEQKNKNYMMDLWLGMYAPSPYELFLGGSYISYDLISGTPESRANHRSYAGSFGAFATIVGLIGEYENNTEENFNDLSGSVNLRVLGNAVQGTHLILQYGVRTRNVTHIPVPAKISQQFAGADLDIYATRFFGFHGNYRGFLPYNESVYGETKGTRVEAGAFIDFGAMKVYGSYFDEKQESFLNGTTTTTRRNGLLSGLKFFF